MENRQGSSTFIELLSDGDTKYLWAPDGSLLAQAPLGGTADTVEAVTDLQGSVREVLDSALDQLAAYSYSAFGQRSLDAGTDVTAMGYTSEQHDETGLIYLRYRYYDPTVGQFISVDPMVAMTLDPYGYANGNPLQIVDPLGLFGWRDVGTVLGYVTFAAAIASVTVATGGTALLVVGGIAAGAGFISTGFSAAEVVADCMVKPNASSCGWSVSGLALGIIPGVKPVKNALNQLGTVARAPLPTNAAQAATAAEKRELSRMGFLTPDAAGTAHGLARNDCQ
jgi:RHS repeat-associated protein